MHRESQTAAAHPAAEMWSITIKINGSKGFLSIYF